jgi:WD40 repeat protein
VFAQHQGPIADIKLSDNQQTILSSSTDGSPVYWDTSDGSKVNEREQNYRITSLSTHKARQRIFVSDALKAQLVWDASSGKQLSQWYASAYSLASSVLAMANENYGQLHTLTSDGVLEVGDIRADYIN